MEAHNDSLMRVTAMDVSGAGDGSVVKRTGVRRTLGWSVVGAALAVVGCEVTPVGEGGVEEMSVVPVAAIAGPSVSVLSVMVSAADIEPALLFNIEMVDGTGSDTLRVPTGPARTFTVEGVSGEGIVTHRGSKTIDVREGLNATLTVALSAVAGDQPVVVTLGGTVVVVTPGVDTTVVGVGRQYTAEVVDEAGDVLPVGVRWATSNAGVAVVDETGVVTGVSEGTARIGATYEGVGGEAAVYVGGPELMPSLSGVVEAWGEGKSGVTVRVEGATGVVDVVTDGTGSYTVGGLLPGSYQVTVSGYTGVRFQSDVLSTEVNWGGNWAEFAGKPDPEPTWVEASESHALRHVCGITATGQAYCWGANEAGQLGNGEALPNTDPEMVPQLVRGDLTWSNISAGTERTCGVTTSGAGYCWGRQPIGASNFADPYAVEPVLLDGGLQWDHIRTDHYSACGVTTSGDAYCWGNNQNGMLGFGTFESTGSPRLVVGGITWSQIDVGQYHTCGVSTDGDAYCWGNDAYGQLGTGSTSSVDATAPQLVVGGHQFVRVDLSRYGNENLSNSCGVTVTGQVFCWGFGGDGSLGDGSSVIGQPTPSLVSGSAVFRSVSAGQSMTCGVTVSDSAWCWGSGADWQGYPNSATPVPFDVTQLPPEDQGIQWFGVGSSHNACILTTSGRLYCWNDPWIRGIGPNADFSPYPTVRVGGAW